MLKVGFTGTRKGLTPEQRARFSLFLTEIPEEFEFHHGDCVGADADAHQVVIELVPQKCRFVIVHPPRLSGQRAFVKTPPPGGKIEILEVQDYLLRNRAIVDCVDIMIGCPSTMHEELRSGTWSTIRYARRLHSKLVVLWPNGTAAYM